MKKPNSPNQLLKFSSLFFQMALIISFFAWSGQKLDIYFKNSQSVFTIILSLFGIAVSLYFVLKDFIKPKT